MARPSADDPRLRDWPDTEVAGPAVDDHFDGELDPPPAPGTRAPSARRRAPAAAAHGDGLRLVAAALALLITGALIGGALTWHALGDAARQAGLVQAWPSRAAQAHEVYVAELRHPVEVAVTRHDAAEQRAQEDHLARWLSRRLQMPVRLFDLRDQGFALVGGRLLPDGAGTGAQLMYEDEEGVRITVYLRRPEAGGSAALRFERQGDLGLFHWVEGATGYALVGALPSERLLALANAVHRQRPGG